MQTHVKALAVLNIVLGSLGALCALVVLAVFGGIAGLVGWAGESDADAMVAAPIIALVGAVVVVFLLVVSVPHIIAGAGLLKYRSWARTLTIVLCALELLNVPFGTALGIYGLWVLLSRETEPLFASARAAGA